MFVDSCTTTINDKVYTRHLLRTTFRKDGKIQHETVANVSRCSDEEIAAMKLALRHKGNLAELVSLREDLSLQQGPSVGAVWLLFDLARQLGIAQALGSDRQGQLALWQVIARAIDQGSRLSAVRLAGRHAACDVLDLDAFDEDDLYANLDWLSEHQARIEQSLFRRRYDGKAPRLFLYDVTSSYLEGMCNELGAFGYCRDGKKGKKQIVIGLLCDEDGLPLSVEVFLGNTGDTIALASAIRQVADRFGGGEVTFVGDRGAIRSRQIQDLLNRGFHYITAITKPQIAALLSAGVIQLGLFDDVVAEVRADDGVRYVLRRNPVRVEEIAASRQDKLLAVQKKVREKNLYLAEHRRAKVEVAVRTVQRYAEKLKLHGWVQVQATDRTISLVEDPAALAEESKLDGCYVLKTDLTRQAAGKELVHERYKDLASVEHGFRTCKTGHLEARPIYVRLESRTRGHVFVVMLAYLLAAELARRWQGFDVTVQEGIDALAGICVTQVLIKGKVQCNQIPQPSESVAPLLEAAKVTLPEVLPSRGVVIATKKKLPPRRQKR